MNRTTLTAWAVAHPWPAVGLAAVGLALTALAAWGAARALHHRKPPPGSVLVAALAAAVCTAYSADTSWRFAEHRLGMSNPDERAFMFAAGEIALAACAVMARRNKAATALDGSAGTAGVPGVLVWVVTGVQIIPAFTESGMVGGFVRAFFGPVMAGLLWHLALGLEIRVARPGALSTGLPAVIGRELRERLLSRLGLATRARSAEQITRDRATATAVRLASRAHLGPWGRHRLAAAVSRSRAAVHGDQRHRLMQELAARRGAQELRTVPLPAPWEYAVPEAYSPRTPLGIVGRELRSMQPFDAVLAVASAKPTATLREIAALCCEYGVPVSETQVGIALRGSSKNAPPAVPQKPAPAPVPGSGLHLDLQLEAEVHPDVRSAEPVLAAALPRRQVHARIDAETEHTPVGQAAAVDPVPDVLDDGTDPLLASARDLDRRTRAVLRKPASIRVLKGQLRIGQARAQALRDQLDTEVTA
ncbi:hypothetical protein [Streptomyces sp. NPDC088674]|uniref:hypothetical protein n=1 Tax=Streptomyces sp. NPDC088674 TaxID=3365869 RepID=UPI003825C5F8